MNIAVTGGNGRLGQAIIAQLLEGGHNIRSLDRAPSKQSVKPSIQELHVDLNNLAALTEALRGCEAVIHTAAFPGPDGHPPGEVYANNTLISYNVLYAASSLGIRWVSMSSSINALGGIGSRIGIFDYFPVDERHPTYNADDYALSKWVMEAQGDSFARRFPGMTISSLRLHAIPDDPPVLQHDLDGPEAPVARTLWGWALIREVARAHILAVQANYTGHEVFFTTAPRTCSSIPSLDLARHAYPNVPILGDLSGRKSFYDCSKAARLLGWEHLVDEVFAPKVFAPEVFAHEVFAREVIASERKNQ